MNLRRIIVFTCLLAVYFSCEESTSDNDNIVLTESPLYVSAQRVTMVGRILSTKGVPSDHGFHISQDPAFSYFDEISLGSKKTPGRFFAEYESLVQGAEYFYRSFLNVGGEQVTGEPISFKSLKTGITGFEPEIGRPGNKVVISGINFPSQAKVFFDDREAEILDSKFESFITVRVPDYGNSTFNSISVETDDTTLTFEDPFEYIVGNWELVGYYPNYDQITSPVYIEKEDVAYVGQGNFYNIRNSEAEGLFWKLDKTNLSWSPFPRPPGSMRVDGPINFPDGYASGRFNVAILFIFISTESWTLDEAENWNPAPPFPLKLYQGIYFESENREFVIGGQLESTEYNDLIFKKGANGLWEPLNTPQNIPVSGENPHFVHDGKFYYVNDDQELWRLTIEDPSILSWERILTFKLDLGLNPKAHLIGDRVFIGLGLTSRVLYEYDIISGELKEKTRFPLTQIEHTAIQWSRDGQLYILKTALNRPGNENPMEIWKLDPDAVP